MTHFYSIGGHGVSVTFTEGQANSTRLIESMRLFETDSEHCQDIILRLTIDDTLRPISLSDNTLIRDFDTGNGMTRVDRMPDGRYQFISRNINGKSCSLIVSSIDFSEVTVALRGNDIMRRFGLTNALMMSYAFRSSFFSTLLLHASVIRYKDYAYAFTAKSGTGKSTHVAQWLQNIDGCDMINDDNPIIRIEQGDVFLYGSPWSGKTPCYRPLRVCLGTICQIKRATTNSCNPLDTMDALATLLAGCSSMRWDETMSDNLYSCLSQLLQLRTCYVVNCLPNADAAFTSCRVLSAYTDTRVKQNNAIDIEE